MTSFLQRHRARLATILGALSGLTYGLTLVQGMTGLSRLSALVFAACATTDIVGSGYTPRPRGTAMVSMAAFVLVMEGAAVAIAQGMDRTSFIEIGVGLYLMAAVRTLLRG
jgi:hypothetical protein